MGRGRATALLPILVEGMLWMRLDLAGRIDSVISVVRSREIVNYYLKASLLVLIVLLISFALPNMPSLVVAFFGWLSL